MKKFFLFVWLPLIGLTIQPAAAETIYHPSLLAPAKIVREANGIPHIFAQNEHDLYFLQGWVHAEDRLFQMDVTRRSVGGTLAELFGLGALSSDVQARTIGLGRAAELSLDAFSPPVKDALVAYSDGVNAFLAAAPALPPEYGVLGLASVKPWTPLDSSMVAKAIGFATSFDPGKEIDLTLALQAYAGSANARNAAIGAEVFDGTALFFEDIFRQAPFDPALTLPGGDSAVAATPPVHKSGGLANLDASTLANGRDYLKRIRAASNIPNMLYGRGGPTGSNQWVVSGAHSPNGRTMLANDVHQPLDNPGLWHQTHLSTPGMDVIGDDVAGAPFILFGHNRQITWGITNARYDHTDVFAEVIVQDAESPSGLSIVHKGSREPIVPLPQTYRANVGGQVVDVTGSPGLPPFVLVVPRRGNGPIVTAPTLNPETGFLTALSIQSVGFGPTRDLEGIYRINRAQNLNAFSHAMRLLDFASQNFVYADVEGNIAYFSTGEIPLRSDLQNFTVDGLPPFLIRDGSGLHDNEWIPDPDPAPDQATPFKILPFNEVPQIVNPPAGFIINANNDPIGNSLDNNTLNQLRRDGSGLYYLNWGGHNFSLRAGRLTRMFDRELSVGDQRLSFNDMKRFQADTVLADAEIFVADILQAFDNGQGAGAHPDLAGLVMDSRVAEAIGRLRQWDFTTPTGLALGFDAEPDADDIAASTAATIYSVWRSRFIVNTIDATLDGFAVGPVLEALNLDEMPKPKDREEEVTALRHLLDNFEVSQGVGASGVNFFQVEGVEDAAARRDIVLLRSLSEALDLLASDAFAAAFGHSTDQDDYRWGRLHRIVLRHVLGDPVPLFNLPLPGLSPLGDALPGFPTDGGFETVDSADHNVRGADSNGFMFGDGPSRRYVARLKDRRVRAKTSLPGGVSGVLGSPFYGNMLEEWLFNDMHSLNVAPDDNSGTVQMFSPPAIYTKAR